MHLRFVKGIHSILPGIASVLFLSFIFSSANAAPLGLFWTGAIDAVVDDTGITDFSGTVAGDVFSGVFIYDDQPSVNEICGPGFCDWFWDTDAGGAISPGTELVSGASISIVGTTLTIEDDTDVQGDPDGLALVNAVLDPDIEDSTPFDIWELSSSEGGDSGDFTWISIDYLSLDTSLFTDTGFRAFPPDAAAVDAIAFIIEQVGPDGSFLAIGTVQLVEIVGIPIPAAVWLFGSALGLLGWSLRRQSVAP